MDEKQLKAAIKKQITNAVGFIGGEISEERQKAMEYYLGEPLGNEIDGRSQVVSTDVQDVIESVMPDIVRPFTASGEAVKFDPVGPEDEQAAEAATDYVNYVWNVDNQGFNIFHDWFKDALLQKNGIIKIWWDDSKKTEKRKFTGVTDDGLAMLMNEDGVEVLEHAEVLNPMAEQLMQEMGITELPDQLPPELMGVRTHDVTIKREVPRGRVCIENVPPEEFLISKRSRALKGAPFVAHRTWPTQSDLIAQGFDKEQIDELPDGDEDTFNAEKNARHSDEEDMADEEADRATREILVHECYLNIDWDGDGIAELRKVTVGGPAFEVLKYKDGTLANEEVDDDPFASVTPIRMPHKFFGRSLAELTQDLQAIKTSIWRQVLDNMYNVNNGRAAISNKVSLEDYLDNKVGAPIRVDTNSADAAGHITPILTPPIGNHAFPLLEYVDTVRETRTGINRLSQGLDPDALKNTATGINQLLGRSQQRTLMIAEVFANGGVKEAMRKVLKLVIENQGQPRKIKLKNQWIDIDPREWNAEMNLSIDVGLGRGTQDQQIATMKMVMDLQAGLMAAQGGQPTGPFVYPHHVSNGARKFLESAGLKSAEPYVAQITKEEAQQIVQSQQQAPPPPEIMLEQMKQQGAQQQAQTQAQLTQQKAELEAQTKQLEHALNMERLGAETQLERTKIQGKQFDLEAEAQKTAMATAAEENKKAMELAAKEHEVAMGLASQERSAELDKASTEHKHDLDLAAADHKAEAAGIKKPKKKAKPGEPAKPTVEDAVLELAKRITEQGEVHKESIGHQRKLVDHISKSGEAQAELLKGLKEEMAHARKPRKAKKGADGSWQIEHA